MRRASTLGVCLSIFATTVSLGGCDSKKPVDTEPTATAAPHALPPPPTPEKEVAPVEKEEEPVKKEPKVCKPGTLVDFAGNTALETQVRFKLAKPKGDVTVA